jgi:hypothetical protein
MIVSKAPQRLSDHALTRQMLPGEQQKSIHVLTADA